MNTDALHIDLYVEGTNNGTQPVEVEKVAESCYRVLYSPGLVEDLAAGDVIHVDGIHFLILERGGNLAIKVAWSNEDSEILVDRLNADFLPLGGRLDGRIRGAAVWIVPVAVGFPRVDATMAKVLASFEDAEWWFGNVYDQDGEPLRWWEG